MLTALHTSGFDTLDSPRRAFAISSESVAILRPRTWLAAAVVDPFRAGSITWRCRPPEILVGGEAGEVGMFAPGWRPVRRPRAGSCRGVRVGRGVGTGLASSSGGR